MLFLGHIKFANANKQDTYYQNCLQNPKSQNWGVPYGIKCASLVDFYSMVTSLGPLHAQVSDGREAKIIGKKKILFWISIDHLIQRLFGYRLLKGL